MQVADARGHLLELVLGCGILGFVEELLRVNKIRVRLLEVRGPLRQGDRGAERHGSQQERALARSKKGVRHQGIKVAGTGRGGRS